MKSSTRRLSRLLVAISVVLGSAAAVPACTNPEVIATLGLDADGSEGESTENASSMPDVPESVVSAVSGTSGMDEAFSVLSPSLPSGSRPSVAMTSGFVHAGTAAALPSTTERATSKRERRRREDFMR